MWGRRLGGLFIFTTENWYSVRFRGKGPKGRPYRTGFRFFRKLGGHETSFPSSFRPDERVSFLKFFLFLVPFFLLLLQTACSYCDDAAASLQRDDGLIALQRASTASCIPPI
jgi:hypothetical protein